MKFMWKMHKVVANLVCKLLNARAFDHLKARMDEEEIETVTAGWKPVDRATINMIERCQDQWQKKDPAYPKTVPSLSTSPVPYPGSTTYQYASTTASLSPSAVQNQKTFPKKCPMCQKDCFVYLTAQICISLWISK